MNRSEVPWLRRESPGIPMQLIFAKYYRCPADIVKPILKHDLEISR